MKEKTEKRPLIPAIKQAFAIKQGALPWSRAIGAGLCIGLPSLFGYAQGAAAEGMLAGIGGFAYLYAGKETYALRSRKLLGAAFGLAFAVALGTAAAPYPVPAAFLLGAIGGLATFLFGALSYKGPSALFFVLGFLLASHMPPDPDAAVFRGTLVLLGGLLAWAIGMAGWFVRPHGPETLAVRRLFAALAKLLDASGTGKFDGARHDALLALLDTESVFGSASELWRDTRHMRRLLLLFGEANVIFQQANRRTDSADGRFPPEWGRAVRGVADALRTGKPYLAAELPDDGHSEHRSLLASIRRLGAILDGEPARLPHPVRITRTSARSVLLGALDLHSIVFLLSVRFAVVLAASALIANAFRLGHAYWVPLSCAAVLLGSTAVATFHRAVQRSLGTFIGLLAASLILYAKPEGYVLIIANMLFTFCTELLIVRNYAFAILFITPNALLMAEASAPIADVASFAGARLANVVLGSVIGLLGVLLIGRKSASSRIPSLLGGTVRSLARLAAHLFMPGAPVSHEQNSRPARAMRTALANLTTVYATALGEVPRDERLLAAWQPAIWSAEQIGYVLTAYAKSRERPPIGDGELAKLLLAFEKLAQSAETGLPLADARMASPAPLPKLRCELEALGAALAAAAEAMPAGWRGPAEGRPPARS